MTSKMREFHLGGIDNVQGVVEAKKLEEVFPLDRDHLGCAINKKSNHEHSKKNSVSNFYKAAFNSSF